MLCFINKNNILSVKIKFWVVRYIEWWILFIIFLLVLGLVENDCLKGINIFLYISINVRLIVMKIWMVKCIVLIYR